MICNTIKVITVKKWT